MSECPEIVVYYRVTAMMGRDHTAAPYIARFWQNGDFLPMIFSGDTPESAEAAARQFWSVETAKIETRRTRLAQARATRLRRVKEGSA